MDVKTGPETAGRMHMVSRFGATALAIVVGVALAAGEIQAQMSCAEAGYLCAASPNEPMMRWPDGKRALRILVSPPAHETPSRALRYQQAATRGIMSWDRIPLELQVFERAGNLEMDIVVEWESQLSETAIGETQVAIGVAGDEAVFQIVRFVLATRIPDSFYDEEEPEAADSSEGESADATDPGAIEEAEPVRSANDPPDPLTLAVVQLTAAHELGHALGLPHSDSPADVMFPETSGASLSRRDIQSVRALYALPVGTRPRH